MNFLDIFVIINFVHLFPCRVIQFVAGSKQISSTGRNIFHLSLIFYDSAPFISFSVPMHVSHISPQTGFPSFPKSFYLPRVALPFLSPRCSAPHSTTCSPCGGGGHAAPAKIPASNTDSTETPWALPGNFTHTHTHLSVSWLRKRKQALGGWWRRVQGRRWREWS